MAAVATTAQRERGRAREDLERDSLETRFIVIDLGPYQPQDRIPMTTPENQGRRFVMNISKYGHGIKIVANEYPKSEAQKVNKNMRKMIAYRLSLEHSANHFFGDLKFPHNDFFGGIRDVMRGVHAGEGGCDDGHHVLTVVGVLSGVPDAVGQQIRVCGLFDGGEHHGLVWSPLPLPVQRKKTHDDHRGVVVGVQLAHPRHQDGALDTAEKTEHVGRDAAGLGER